MNAQDWTGDVRIVGGGEIGGKAQGLVRIAREVLAELPEGDFPEFRVRVPDFTVIGTHVFDAFMRDNDLEQIATSGASDERIAHAFQRGDLPPGILGELRALISERSQPLAVRSSSLLEDALDHPFAGVYATKMTPNNQTSPDERFKRLLEAVKYVYASAFFSAAVSYRASLGRDDVQEKMAVIIQEVVGRAHGERFYPAVSGVARTFNYYPSGSASPHDGVVSLALGLGRQIVDGGACWTYVPAYPMASPPYSDVGERLDASQQKFWSVNLGTPPLPDPVEETEFLVEYGLDDADYDGSLEHLVSTYDPRSERMRCGRLPRGPWSVDFAPMLTLGTLPINSLIQRMLSLAEQAVGGAVEIEFAVDVPSSSGSPARFGFLQMRPMAVEAEGVSVSDADFEGDGTLVRARHALGNGVREDIHDIVYLDPDSFEAGKTSIIALELAEFNRRLLKEGRPYLLLGFGRWGSADPWLGVPVTWGQISGVRALVEASLPTMNPDISQGSHFFHNLIGLKIMYMATGRTDENAVDWDWLAAQPAEHSSTFVRHVRCDQPLKVAVDGLNSRGVVIHD